MSYPADLSRVLRQLAETVAWGRQHVSAADPKDSLRTNALRPANLEFTADQWGNFEYEWGTEQNRQVPLNAVAELAEARANLLRGKPESPDVPLNNLMGGRLLIARPDESDWCGISEPETAGFIDVLDVPAWDTWVCYVQEPLALNAQGMTNTTVSYLLCWIPPELISLVSYGILVNPVECFFWAVEYKQRYLDTELLRQLDAKGLLT